MRKWIGWETVRVTFSLSEFIGGQLLIYGYSRTRTFCNREEKLCMGEEVRGARTQALRCSHPRPPHCTPGVAKKN